MAIMLTPQLAIIKKRLETSTRYNVDGSEPLYQELIRLENLLNDIEGKTMQRLEESEVIKCCRATTSGPGNYCSCCGKAL
jgi:hypothetical protein